MRTFGLVLVAALVVSAAAAEAQVLCVELRGGRKRAATSSSATEARAKPASKRWRFRLAPPGHRDPQDRLAQRGRRGLRGWQGRGALRGWQGRGAPPGHRDPQDRLARPDRTPRRWNTPS
jgi:hypothetical protein